MIIKHKLVLDADFDKELFWIDRKNGGRLYMLFNVGVYDMSHIRDGIKVLSLTLPFATFKIGWIFDD